MWILSDVLIIDNTNTHLTVYSIKSFKYWYTKSTTTFTWFEMSFMGKYQYFYSSSHFFSYNLYPEKKTSNRIKSIIDLFFSYGYYFTTSS